MEKGFQYLKNKLADFPSQAGCYLMRDHDGEIFYIGKAKNLKTRLKSYFLGSDTRIFVQFLEQILADIEILVVHNDIEALVLERELIKKHQPRFNIMLKDDKNYILLRLKKIKPTGRLRERYPRLEIVRKHYKDQARYFGPYPSAHSLRTTVDLINKHFLLRTCSDQVIENRVRPCIQYQIGRCLAPCLYPVESYQQELENIALFLSGSYQAIKQRLETKMQQMAEQEQFEAAAKIRDQLLAVKTSLTSQVISEVNQRRNQDLIGFARMGPKVEMVQIKIRHGSWHHSHNYSFDNHFPSEEIMRAFLQQAYSKSQDLPQDILLPIDIGDELSSLSQTLEQQCRHRVHIYTPIKGKHKKLIDLAQKNAEQALKDVIDRQNASDQALIALQNRLGLAMKPERIECIDISLIQGSEPYGSCVVFINGQADKSLYRVFSIKNVEGMNDFAMIREVVSRRVKQGINKQDLPDLLLIDGGKGQLSSAIEAIEEANLLIAKDGFFVAGIAKARSLKDRGHSDERLFIPNQSEPIILAAHTFERYLVERIRDEAHRFALSAHRRKRSKRTLESQLLKIPGIGPKRALALLKHFGSTKNIAHSSAEELSQAIGLSLSKSQEIIDFLNPLD